MPPAAPKDAALEALLGRIRGCRLCAAELPLGPRPVLRASTTARLLIVGQAPGTKVHESGIPWNDPSGERLREWLDIDRDSFYDRHRIAIVPMGFCYPGRHARGGDLPPRPECAPAWQAELGLHLDRVELTLLVGQYAQAWHLGARRRSNLTETVRAWADYGPAFLPLPHPSWRTVGWAKRNPWFEAEVLPELRRRVRALLGAASS
jgi:uracil-DNA glycosylase